MRLIFSFDTDKVSQPANEIVHCNTSVELTDTAVCATSGAATVPLPVTTVHLPVPTDGVLAFTVVDVPHPMSWSGPALDFVGGS